MKLKAGLLVAKGVSDSFVKQALHCNSGRAYSLHNGAKSIMNSDLRFFCNYKLMRYTALMLFEGMYCKQNVHCFFP